MSGLIPDLGSETAEIKRSELILQFSYDNSLEEIDGAMKTFQKKFAGKKGIITTVAYGILTAASLAAIIINYDNILPYLAFAICAFSLVYNITDRQRTRNKTIEALKDMPPEEYTASIFPDKIEIDTIIKPKENEANISDNADNSEKAEEGDSENSREGAENEEITPIKSTFLFGTDMLDFAENSDSLLLIASRRQIYCFPKRCLTREQEETLRRVLSEKLDSAVETV